MAQRPPSHCMIRGCNVFPAEFNGIAEPTAQTSVGEMIFTSSTSPYASGTVVAVHDVPLQRSATGWPYVVPTDPASVSAYASTPLMSGFREPSRFGVDATEAPESVKRAASVRSIRLVASIVSPAATAESAPVGARPAMELPVGTAEPSMRFQVAPFQWRSSARVTPPLLVVPPAQTSLPLRAATEVSALPPVPGLGLGTTAHEVPFQCSI